MGQVKDCIIHGDYRGVPAWAGDMFGFNPCTCKDSGWKTSDAVKDMLSGKSKQKDTV